MNENEDVAHKINIEFSDIIRELTEAHKEKYASVSSRAFKEIVSIACAKIAEKHPEHLFHVEFSSLWEIMRMREKLLWIVFAYLLPPKIKDIVVREAQYDNFKKYGTVGVPIWAATDSPRTEMSFCFRIGINRSNSDKGETKCQ